MSIGVVEHVNLTVSEPQRTARLLSSIFGWHIRWSGPAKDDGQTVHVGTENSYVALYTVANRTRENSGDYLSVGRLNHIGVVVSDLDEVEKRVIEAGFKPHNHGNYEPGARFYFNDHDGIEYEVVSYA